MSKRKLVIIDGNSLLYRAYYALPTTLATKAGVVTNAVYGFTSMLIKLIKDEKPDCLAVAFDKGRADFREEILKQYKAHRSATPDDLVHQFELIREILDSLNIPIYEFPGYEADDILATVATKAASKETEVIVVTGDKDAFQLINDNVKIMTTRRGITDIVIYDAKKVEERYGIGPDKIRDFLGLKGDPSDNIPGVPGIGEKTASKLLQEFGSLESVLEHAEEIKGDKLKNSLKEYADQARASKKVATMIRDVLVDIDYEKCALGWDFKKAEKTFTNIEFNTLLERVREISPEATVKEVFGVNIVVVNTLEDLKNLAADLKICESISIGSKTNNHRLEKLYLCRGGLVSPDQVVYEVAAMVENLAVLKEILESQTPKIGFISKPAMLGLRFAGIRLSNLVFDCKLAAYLLNSGGNSSLSTLVKQYLGINLKEDETDREAEKAYFALKLRPVLEKELEKFNLKKVYDQIELPLIPVLCAMEYRGVGVSVSELKRYSAELEQLINGLVEEIYRLAVEEFNINSPKQLSAILFDKLNLKPTKKTKTGFSTDSSVLIKLIKQHQIVENIVNYRELAKLKSTYIDALPLLVDKKTKRLHTCFNQEGTATGRLASSNPNLQNIPIRTELGRQIRNAFMPANPNDELLVADYSQIELRILAHLSNDKDLIKAFESGNDVHRATAAEVFGVSVDEVTPDMRRGAKAVNFGIVYGISAHGLSEQLGVSREEAADYIDRYFNRYSGVKKYINNIIAQAYKDGYVKTMYGRIRFIPELKSGDLRVRNFGERTAVNSVMQGSAADIIKIAMIAIEKELIKREVLSRMVLQVHDELIFEVPLIEKRVVKRIVKDMMENTTPINPKIEVGIKFGRNWLEAKD